MGRIARSRVWTWIIPALVAGLALLIGFYFRPKRENRFDAQILKAAERYRIPPALIKAVIWQESKFLPYVRGRAGEIGLMQIREEAAIEGVHGGSREARFGARVMSAGGDCGRFPLDEWR